MWLKAKGYTPFLRAAASLKGVVPSATDPPSPKPIGHSKTAHWKQLEAVCFWIPHTAVYCTGVAQKRQTYGTSAETLNSTHCNHCKYCKIKAMYRLYKSIQVSLEEIAANQRNQRQRMSLGVPAPQQRQSFLPVLPACCQELLEWLFLSTNMHNVFVKLVLS